MSNSLQFDGSKPLRVVTYTSGTGTFTPLVANSLCRVTVVAGGAGGGRGKNGAAPISPGLGGGAGEGVQAVLRLTGAQAYSVGAGGAGATVAETQGAAGSQSSLGPVRANGGFGGLFNTSTNGGKGGGTADQSTLLNWTQGAGRTYGGAGGGCTASVALAGNCAGAPYQVQGLTNNLGSSAPGAAGGSYPGGGGGGDSLVGLGANGGAGNNGGVATAGAAAAANSGGGGGGGGAGGTTGNGGNGGSGIIIIEEFGA